MANYFQPHNLTALREMALLWVADQVEVALQRYRTDQRVTDVVGDPGTGRGRADRRPGERDRAAPGRPHRQALRLGRAVRGARAARRRPGRRARSGRWPGCAGWPRTSAPRSTRVVGDDVPAALLDFARGVDATQLVLGTSRRSRLARSVVEGIGARVVQDSGHDRRAHGHPRRGRPRAAAAPAVQRGAAAAAGRWAGRWRSALPLLATVIGTLGRELVGLSTDVVLFFLATVVVALVGGLGPALLAAFAGALLLNFFLTPPLYTFTIAERENVITLVAMVLVAVLVALVVDRAARRAQQAAAARAEAALLASFSRTVLTGPAAAAPAAGPGARGVRADHGGRAAAPRRAVADLRLLGPAGLHPPGPGRRRRGRGTRHPPRRARAARCPPPTAGCSRPSPGRPCSRCATSRSPPRPPRPAAAPTPPSCAPPCSPPSATTCAPRWPRSRPRPAACATRTCRCPTPTGSSWPPPSTSRPTGSPGW